MKITQRAEEHKVRINREKYACYKNRRTGRSYISAFFMVTLKLKPIKIYHKNKPKKHGKTNHRQGTKHSN